MDLVNKHIDMLRASLVIPEPELKYISLLTSGSANTKLAKGEAKKDISGFVVKENRA